MFYIQKPPKKRFFMICAKVHAFITRPYMPRYWPKVGDIFIECGGFTIVKSPGKIDYIFSRYKKKCRDFAAIAIEFEKKKFCFFFIFWNPQRSHVVTKWEVAWSTNYNKYLDQLDNRYFMTMCFRSTMQMRFTQNFIWYQLFIKTRAKSWILRP